MKTLSVVIATKNEENNMVECLESVNWADEIVIVDMFSSDKTVEICSQYTDKIYQHFEEKSSNPIEYNKNLGFEKASGDWMLYIDADERISPELRNEIVEIVQSKASCDGYIIPYRNYFMGKWLRHGGWYPERHIRLFKKGRAWFDCRIVHEPLRFDGEVGWTKNEMVHYVYNDITHFFTKHNFYTSREAEAKFKYGVTFRAYKLFFFPLKNFLNRYLRLNGFLDGYQGFLISVLTSISIFIGWTKLGELSYKAMNKKRRTRKIGMDISAIRGDKAGVGYYIRNLIAHIVKFDYQNDYEFLEFKMDYSRSKVRNFIFRNILWEQFILPWKLIRTNVKVAHFPAYVSPLFRTCRSIVSIHDMSFLLYPEKFLKLYRLYLKIWVPLSAKRADIVIADSIQSKRDIVKLLKVPEEKVEVIYLGVSESFRPMSDDERLDEIRTKYNLPQEFILYVGTIEPRKNIIGLIYAYGELKKKVGDTVKIVIGGKMGWLYDNIIEAIEDLELKEDVIFTGYIPDEDLPLVYNAAKLFVYPSLYEGFGLPPLEAMACGIPVITSNTSSLPELVNGVGIMVDPDNPRELAEAIYKVLTNEELRKKMIKMGLEKAKEFTWEKTSKKTLEVYEKVLSRT